MLWCFGDIAKQKLTLKHLILFFWFHNCFPNFKSFSCTQFRLIIDCVDTFCVFNSFKTRLKHYQEIRYIKKNGKPWNIMKQNGINPKIESLKETGTQVILYVLVESNLLHVFASFLMFYCSAWSQVKTKF